MDAVLIGIGDSDIPWEGLGLERMAMSVSYVLGESPKVEVNHEALNPQDFMADWVASSTSSRATALLPDEPRSTSTRASSFSGSVVQMVQTHSFSPESSIWAQNGVSGRSYSSTLNIKSPRT